MRLEALHAATGIDQNEAALDAVSFQQPRDHHRALIGCRRTAQRGGRNGHQQVTALEFDQLALQCLQFTGQDAGRVVPPHGVDGADIVAQPRAVIVADAGGKNQPVVAERALRAMEAAPFAVDCRDLGPDRLIAVGPRRRAILLLHQCIGGSADQPFVA